MHKQKAYCGKGMFKAVSLFLLTSLPVVSVCFTSCSADDIAKKGNNQGPPGFVSVNLNADTAFVATKASPDPEKPDEYQIRILQEDQVITSFSVADMPEKIALDPGEYTAKASWGELLPAAFESLYMEGTAAFSIKEGATEQIVLNCTPANAKVTVDYTADFKQVYSDYSVSMTTAHTGSSPLKFRKDEQRAAYFQANAAGEPLKLEMNLQAAGKNYNFTDGITVKPRDFVRLHFRLSSSGGSVTPDPDPDPTPDPGPTPNPTPDPEPEPDIPDAPAISTGISGIMLPANGEKEEIVTVVANTDWTVANAENWLNAEKKGDKVHFKAQPNDTGEGRSATVTLTAVKGNKTVSVSIFVVQLPAAADTSEPSISVNIISLNMPAAGFSQEIEVVCSHDWTLKTDEESNWLTVTPGTGKLTLSAEANTTGTTREGSVTLTTQSGGRTASIHIHVKQVPRKENPVISVDFSALTFSGNIDFEMPVSINQSAWTVQSTAAWLTATRKGENKVRLQADALASGEEPREAIIRLTATEEGQTVTVDIKIKQNPLPPVVLPSSIGITVEINDTFVKDTVITRLLDIPAGTGKPLTLLPVGFSSGGLLTLRKGEAPASLYINIAAYGKIAGCQWEDMMNFETIDLTAATPDQISRLQGEGLFWDSSMKGQKYSTLYLDQFVKKLAEGNHSYTLSVTDETGQKESVTLKIQITK